MGTTMLVDTISRHLITAGKISSKRLIYEVFNPVDDRRLVIKHNHLHNIKQEPSVGIQSREDRFDLFSSFNETTRQGYIIKVMSTDLDHPLILPWLIDNYQIITIERRDLLETLLSWLIAWENQTWNYRQLQKAGEIEPFFADMNTVAIACNIYARYLQRKSRIPSIGHIYYEDMVQMTPEQIVKQVGMFQPGFPCPLTGERKMHTMGEKAKLIKNLDEVVSYYNETLATMASIDW